MTGQVTKQFVVVPAEAVDESQALGRIAFFDADGAPLDVSGGSEPVSIAWADVSGKPTEFTPEAHSHSADDVSSGTFAAARIPALAVGKVSGLQATLDDFESRIAALESAGA